MQEFIDIFTQWTAGLQVFFCLGSMFILTFAFLLFLVSLNRTIRILIRGYPTNYYTPHTQECNNDDNLTGFCIKPGGCRTIHECHNAIDSTEQ